MRKALGENLNLIMLGRVAQLIVILLQNRPVFTNSL